MNQVEIEPSLDQVVPLVKKKHVCNEFQYNDSL